jgi:hypothetical protein
VTIAATAPAVNTENWTPVAGYEGIYEVSNWGRVKRVRAANSTTVGRILKLYVNGCYGHLQAHLCTGGRCRHMLVHRLVLEAFVGPCPVGQECRHLDGNPANNNVENLAWGTRTENQADRVRHGTSSRGEQSVLAKLTEDDVREIRRLLGQGLTQTKISSLFGVSRVTISKIKLGKLWAHSID